MEEFPTLPNLPKNTRKKRSPSACSSVSTASIGALATVKTKIQNGSYYTLERVAVRPSLKCQCECCGAKVPEENQWNLKCNKAIYVANTEIECEVTASKVIRHGHRTYSVAFIETDYYKNDRKVRGWVLSKTLERYYKPSQSQTLRAPTPTVEVVRSRSPSVSTFIAESPFQFGDLVLVRTDAATDEWVRGEVRQEKPLLILVEGTSKPQRFHAQNIKTHSTREFVTTVKTSVRSQKFKNSAAFQTLNARTTISVAYIEGYEARITAPVNGWISCRTANFLNMIEPNWTYSPQSPTIIISNISADTTEAKLKRALKAIALKPTSITFQSRGDEFRAVVSLRNKRARVAFVVGRKLQIVNHFADVNWDVRFLKNLAAFQLQKK